MSSSCAHCCTHSKAASTTIDEMSFDRGLWKAALDGDISRVDELLAKGKNPNEQDSYGYSALHYAARYGHLSIVRKLLAAGACRKVTTNGGVTAAHRAALMGHQDVLWELVEGVVSAVDADGDTIAHKAAKGGHRKLADEIIERFPQLNDVRNGRQLLWSEIV